LPLAEEVVNIRLGKSWSIANHWTETRAAPVAAEIVALLESIVINEDRLMADVFLLGKTQNDFLSMIEWALLIIGLSACGLLGLVITRSVSLPIAQTLSIAKAVAAGDFDIKINLTGSRDIAILGNALTAMTQALRETTAAAHAVATGNLDVTVEVRGEKDTLARAINAMVAALKISKVQTQEQLTALGDSEARANSIIDNMEDGLVSITPRGIITLFNPAAERIFQYRADQIIGKNISTLVPSPHSEKHDQYLSNYLNTGDRRFIGAPRQVEARRKNGSSFPASIVVSEIKLTGEPIFIGTVRDISEQVKAENAERASKQALEYEKEKLLEQDWLKSSFAQISEKTQGTRALEELGSVLLNELIPCLNAHIGVLYVKQDLEKCQDTTVDTVLSLIASYAYIKHNTLSTSYRLGEGLVGQCALEKKPMLLLQPPEDRLRIDTGLGEIKPTNIILLPVLFEGQLIGVLEVASLHNLTELQQELLQQITDHLGILINTIVGRQRTEYLLQRSQLQAQELKKREHLLQQTNIELKRNTREAEQANRSKSEFLANMSHELRTPLNSLLILAESLANNHEKNLNEQQLHACQIIHQSGSDLLTLINDILDLAKVEAGKIVLDQKVFLIKTLATSLKNKFNPIAEKKGLNFTVDIATTVPPQILSDRMRLEQILKNFLSNAFKFTHEGSVKISIARPAPSISLHDPQLHGTDTIAITITDTGIGIEEEKLAKIFETFEQVDGSTNREYGGTGLGLSISTKLARLLGGEIQVKSGSGKGSTFSIYLPVHSKIHTDQPWVTDEHITAPHSVQHNETMLADHGLASLVSQNNTILVIEDDPIFAETLRKTVHHKGCQCLIATTGEEGLKLARIHQPNAVLLDINLPDIDGREVFATLKKEEKTAHIPSYFISAHNAQRDTLAKGAIGYLTKPVNQGQLNEAMDQIRSLAIFPLKTVLVVEDDQVIRDHTIDMLEAKGLSVDSAERALEIIHTQMVDAMILDLTLPAMSGLALLETIAADPVLFQPPVMIYSAKDISDDERHQLQHYTNTFIKKNNSSSEDILNAVITNLSPAIKQPEPRPTVAASADNDEILKGKYVLLVDDDPRNLFAISVILKQVQMNVVMAENGQKALEVLAENESIDIVLTDIMMPIMDGYETIVNIRQQPQFSDLPIIAITAKAMKEDKDKCLSIGANDYLAKPIERSTLLTMMGQWIQHRYQKRA